MLTNHPVRRAEHAHTKRCLAAAMIASIENARDLEFFTDFDFAIYAASGAPINEARGYLLDGTASCSCNADGTNPCLQSCCDYGLVDGIEWSEPVRDCDKEFGVHDHDDAECGRMLDTMNGIGVDDGSWEAEAYNREAAEMSLGRPLFPNEY